MTTKSSAAVGGSAGASSPLYDYPASRPVRRWAGPQDTVLADL